MPPTSPSSEDSPAPNATQQDATSQLDTLPTLPMQQVPWLRAQTPARVGLRRTGISLATSEVLDFQLAHARARDAVHASLQPASLLAALRTLSTSSPAASSPVAISPLLLHSEAPDRQTYLQRPDLGRRLNQTSQLQLHSFEKTPDNPFDLAIVIADGLSALAVERHALPLLSALFPRLASTTPALRIAPLCLVEQARVAIGDEIAHALRAQLAVLLIGERPGLSSPDSLGVYITWQPEPGRTTDAERNCISNIRTEGLSYDEAAVRLAFYIHQAQSRRMTGIALKDPESARLSLETQTGPHS